MAMVFKLGAVAVVVIILAVLAWVLFFRKTEKPEERKIVSITAPSGGSIVETYVEYADPTIQVTGLRVTLPTSYGEYTFNDGTTEPAELTKMVLELRQGDRVLGKKEYTKTTANPPVADWFKVAQAGESFTIVLKDDLLNYVSTETGVLEAVVSFTNDPAFEAAPATSSTPIDDPERFQTGTGGAITGGEITEGLASYIGAPPASGTQYATLANTGLGGEGFEFLNHVATDAQGTTVPALQNNPSLDACKSRCNELATCEYIVMPSNGSTCSFFKESLPLATSTTSTVYEKQ